MALSISKNKKVPACILCSLHAGKKTVAIPASVSDGYAAGGVVIVGEAPGDAEDASGVPFTGDTGKFFRSVLAEAGVTNVAFTYLIRCQPLANRPASPKEQKICGNAHLVSELQRLKPGLIVAAGDAPMRFLVGKGGVLKAAGSSHDTVNGLVYVMPSPAYVFRNPAYLKQWLALVKQIPRFLGNGAGPTLNYRFLNTASEVRAALEIALKQKAVAFDYETTGLNPYKDRPISVALSWSLNEAVCFDPWKHADLWSEYLRGSANLVAHSSAFEVSVSAAHFGVFPTIIWDTLIGAMLKDENGAHGLKPLALLHTNLGSYGHKEKKEMGTEEWKNRTASSMLLYNSLDADGCLQVYHTQEADVDHERMKLSLNCIQSLARARHNGFLIDRSFLSSLSVDLQLEIDKIKAKMREQQVFRDFEKDLGEEYNINSPPQTRELVISRLHFKPTSYSSKTGQPSVGADFLNELDENNPIVGGILRWRVLDKMLKNFIPNLVDTLDDKSITHPSWRFGGAKTWRISCADPNLMNIPKADPMARRIRKAFIVPEGYSLVEMDYSQIELRVLASIAGVPQWIEAFLAGADIHRATAASMFGVAPEEVTDDQRSVGKSLNFSTIYGITPYGLRVRFGIPESQGELFINAFKSNLPSITRWMGQQHAEAARTGIVRSPFGAVRHLPDAQSKTQGIRNRAFRQAGNFPVQSGAAEITLRAQNRLAGAFDPSDVVFLGQVHDSILLQIRSAVLVERVREAVSIMTDTSDPLYGWVQVPLLVDVKAGPNWYDMKGLQT